jgi:hypothetical protein
MNTFELNNQLLGSALNRQKEILLMYHAAATALKQHIEQTLDQEIEPAAESNVIDVDVIATSVPNNVYQIDPLELQDKTSKTSKIANFNLSDAKNIQKKKISIYG